MVVKYQFPTKQINERLKTQAPESGVIKNLLENLSKKKMKLEKVNVAYYEINQ